ncbi:MAG: polyketide-type polyunsaturated fatty acid synthase PfaA, partial [Candidatus Aldehydirespiratoraceae bacterium]
MSQTAQSKRPPIAIVGVSALFPGSVDSTGFWNDILAGTDRMTDVPASHWLIDDHFDADPSVPDRTYGRRGGFLDPVDFDAMHFGVPPSVVPSTDTAQLLALIVAQRVLDDATRGQFTELDRTRASVILGVTSGQELFGAMASRMNRPMWLQGMRRAGIAEDVALEACDKILALHPEWTESTFPGLLGNVVAGRIANRLDLGGTNCVTDAACASSFSAISMGVNELYLGDSDLVIAGGVDTMNDIFMYMCFSKTPALSKSEDIRPFSDQADGTMLGEGIGMVALKRLEDAERDGNDIYCIVNGVGASSDGRSKSVYAPVSSGQARALGNAYDKAGYGPDTVELIEAHGTGTVAGDAAEFGGLELSFNATERTDRQWCALGSVKSQIGHTKAAAGAAGLFKVVMALHHKVLPQTAKIDQPNPKMDLVNSPFHLNTKTRPWVRNSDHERRGSVSSFGFGGSNFHIALSEYTGDATRAPRLRSHDVELVTFSGTDTADLLTHVSSTIEGIVDDQLAYLAQTSQRNYDSSAAARLAVVASDEGDLVAKLTQAIETITRQPNESFSTPSGVHFGVGMHTGDVAFLFPGQGSQYVGMGADLAMNFSEAMKAWDLAADQEWDETTLQDVVFPITSFEDGASSANQSLLTATHWAQPAIGTMSLSLLRLLRSVGVEAQHVGGHSFGEITALHAGGVLTEADMVRVAQR